MRPVHLNPIQHAVYKVLLRYSQYYDYVCPSQERIAEEAGCCRQTVNVVIKQLEQMGLIKKERRTRPVRGGNTTCRYIVYRRPVVVDTVEHCGQLDDSAATAYGCEEPRIDRGSRATQIKLIYWFLNYVLDQDTETPHYIVYIRLMYWLLTGHAIDTETLRMLMKAVKTFGFAAVKEAFEIAATVPGIRHLGRYVWRLAENIHQARVAGGAIYG